MKNIYILFAVIAVIAVILVIIKSKGKVRNKTSDKESDSSDNLFEFYQKNQYILSQAEYSFYKCLLSFAPVDRLVIIKIRLADIFCVKKGSPGWKSKFNKVAMKHFDFVVLDKKTAVPLFAIELDDLSHDSESENDTFKDGICAATGFKLHRVKVAKGYTESDISKLFI